MKKRTKGAVDTRQTNLFEDVSRRKRFVMQDKARVRARTHVPGKAGYLMNLLGTQEGTQ